jgi:antitoxin HigA-1
VTRQTLNDLVRCRRGISPEMAIRLDMGFGGGAGTSVRPQAAHDLAQARKTAKIDVEHYVAG